MLAIILMILKIIGIIIGALLGLVLLLVLFILFIPIRYKIKASYYESPKGFAVVSWFLNLISIKAELDDKTVKVRAKILFFTVFDSQKQGNEDVTDILEKDSQNDSLTTSSNNKMEEAHSLDNYQVVNDKQPRLKSFDLINENKSFEPKEIPVKINTNISPQIIKEEKPKRKKKNKFIKFFVNRMHTLINILKSIKEKILQIINNIKNSILNLINSITNANEKIKLIKEKINKVIEFFKDEDNKTVIKKLKNHLIKLIKIFIPKKFIMNIHFGTNSPDTTGQILAVIGVLYPIFKNNIKITVDFEEQIIEGDFFIKGHIRIIKIVILGLKIIVDKQIRIFIGKVRKMIALISS